MEDIDNKLIGILGAKKIHKNILPSYTTNQVNAQTHKQSILDVSEQWRKWSGNYTQPPSLSPPSPVPLPSSRGDGDAAYKSSSVGEYVGIPFKPIYWTTLLAHKDKDTASTISNQHYEDGDGYGDGDGEGEYSMEAFIRSIPWLYMFVYEGINDLEEYMVEEVYHPGDVILQTNDVATLNIIVQGEVMASLPHPTYPTSPPTLIHSLHRGDVFGFTLTPDAPSVYTYKAHSRVVICSLSLSYIHTILSNQAIETSIQQYELTYLKHGLYNEFHNACAKEAGSGGEGEGNSVYVQRAQISYLFQQIQRYMQRIHNNYRLQSLFMQLFSLCSPSLTLKDIIEDTLKLVKDMLEVDRASIYILDTSYTFMYLYTLVTSDLAGSGDASSPTPTQTSSLISGLKMPLKGVAAYVAKHNLHINVTDAYQIEFFDMSMDIKTGYRTKQMLCVPIHNSQGEVVGVIQGINTLVKGLFGKEDEEMLAMVGKVLSSHVCDLRAKEYTSQSKLGKPSYLYPGVFTCKLVGGYMFKEHRHIKFNIHLFLGGRNPPITKQTKLYNTSSDSAATSKCLFAVNELLEFTTIRQSDINLQCSVVIEAFSKNNHPIGWVYMPLYTQNQRRVRGEGGNGVEYLIIAGGMPTNWMEIMFDANSSLHDVSKVLYAQQSIEEKLDEDSREYVGALVMDWGVHEFVYYDIDYRTKYAPYQNLNYVGIDSTPDGAQVVSTNTLSSQLIAYCTSCALDRPFIGRLLQFFNFEQTYLSVLEIDPNIHEFLLVHGPRLVAYDARFAIYIFVNFDYQYLHKTKAVMQLLHSPAVHNFSVLLPLVTGSLQNNRLLTLLANSMYTILPGNEGLIKNIMPAMLHCYQLDNTVNNGILIYFLHSLINSPAVFGVYAYWHVQSILMLEPMRNHSKISYLFKDIHRLLPSSVLHPVTKGFDFLYQIHMSYFKLMLSGENVSTPTERSSNVYKLMLEQLPMSPQSDPFALPLAASCGQLFTHIKSLDQHAVFKAGTAFTVAGRDDKATLSLIYLPSFSPRHSLYHDFLRSVDFIFSVNEVQLRTLQTNSYHIYAETSFLLDFPNAASMQSLISAALAQASPPKTREKSMFFKSNDFAMKKIPEDLLTQHFLTLETKSANSDNPFDMDKALDTYWYSLASYLLVAHVLSLQTLTGQNVLVSQQGELIAFYPSDFLGIDDTLLDKAPEEFIKVA